MRGVERDHAVVERCRTLTRLCFERMRCSTAIEQEHSDVVETEAYVLVFETSNRRVELVADYALPHRLITRVECLAHCTCSTGEGAGVVVHLKRFSRTINRVL